MISHDFNQACLGLDSGKLRTTSNDRKADVSRQNPLHAGFLIAKAQGKYDEANLQVDLISPADDNYATTPAKKLSSGEVEFALCPSESIISFQTSSTPVKIKACAALLARDASVIVSRSAKSPKELVGEGKVYAS